MLKNLRHLRKAAIVLLSAFFFGCDSDTDIKLPVGTIDQNALFSDNLSLEYGTYLMDSAITSNQNFGLIGEAVDPIFGKITASTVFQPTLRPSAIGDGSVIPFEYDEPITADSVVLNITNRNLLFYGDSTKILNLGLYRLESPLARRNYNFDDKVTINKDPLNIIRINYNRFINPADSSRIGISVKLPASIVEELNSILGTEDGKDANKFREKFPGFVLRPIGSSSVIFGMDLSPTSANIFTSSLTFYATTPANSTISYSFELGSPRFIQVEADRSATNLSALVQKKEVIPPSGPNRNVFVQAGTGVAAWMRFPGVKTLSRSSKVIKAEVVWEMEENTRTRNFQFSPILVPLETRADGSIRRDALSEYSYISLIRNSISSSPAIYSDSLNTYRLDITSYIRDLVTKNDPDNGVVFAAGGLSGNANSAAVVFNGGLNRVVLKNPKLELYYTK